MTTDFALFDIKSDICTRSICKFPTEHFTFDFYVYVSCMLSSIWSCDLYGSWPFEKSDQKQRLMDYILLRIAEWAEVKLHVAFWIYMLVILQANHSKTIYIYIYIILTFIITQLMIEMHRKLRTKLNRNIKGQNTMVRNNIDT